LTISGEREKEKGFGGLLKVRRVCLVMCAYQRLNL
jgi:hypothetical protein